MVSEIKEHNLFSLLTKTPRPYIHAPIPVFNENGESLGTVAIQELSQHDCDEIAGEVELRMKKKFGKEMPKKEDRSKAYDELYNQYSAEGVIFRSVRRVENLDCKFFPSVEDVGKYLSSEQVAILMNYYYTLITKLSGGLEEMTDDKAKDWVEKIADAAKKKNHFFLDSISQVIQKELLKYLVNQLMSLQTSKSNII